jgi:hypothetical protein
MQLSHARLAYPKDGSRLPLRSFLMIEDVVERIEFRREIFCPTRYRVDGVKVVTVSRNRGQFVAQDIEFHPLAIPERCGENGVCNDLADIRLRRYAGVSCHKDKSYSSFLRKVVRIRMATNEVGPAAGGAAYVAIPSLDETKLALRRGLNRRGLGGAEKMVVLMTISQGAS